MGANFDINIVFEARPSPDLRSKIIHLLAEASKEWVDFPTTMMALDVSSWVEQDFTYSDEALDQLSLTDKILVFLYPLAFSSTAGSYGIEENPALSRYSVSVPNSWKDVPASYEDWLIRLFRIASSMGRVVLLAGEELTVDLSAGNVDGLVQNRFKGSDLTSHILISSGAARPPEGFELLQELPDVILFRRVNWQP